MVLELSCFFFYISLQDIQINIIVLGEHKRWVVSEKNSYVTFWDVSLVVAFCKLLNLDMLY